MKNSHRPIELAIQLQLLLKREGRLAVEQLAGLVADINHRNPTFLNRAPCHRQGN